MKKAELWKIFTEKNPSFNGEGNITMSAAGLRKLFDQTYDNGFEQGKTTAAALHRIAGNNSILGEIFGGMKK